MAYVQNKDFSTVSKAYANYFLVKHTLFENLVNILSNDTNDKKVNHNSFVLALKCVYCHISININELESNIINQISHTSKKYKDWQHEILQDIKSASEKIHPKYRVGRSILVYIFSNRMKIFIHLLFVTIKIKLFQIIHKIR